MNQRVRATQDADMSDGALADQIIQGKRVAEVELYRRFQPRLSRMLNSVTADPADAADIHQEVLRIVIEKLRAGELRDKNKLTSFIFQVGRYQTLGYYRKQRKLQFCNDMEIHIDPDIDDPVRTQYRAIVREVIDSMERDRDRLILYMFYIQEREKPEICEILSLGSLHFSRVLFRARQRFKLKWETRIDADKQDSMA
ncbi:MAG: RNA polymerase sigma-70 factor (ECF subfamily) [Candidatus Azotimanducaceae bacterium]|jgi:RNA polymerase sigma-70 factor (ECF subfamily)